MAEEKKLTLEEFDELLDKEESSFNFRELYTMLILNWQWFAISLVACLIVAVLYLRYASPVYQVSSKMLIKDDNNRRRGSDMLANMQDLGHSIRLTVKKNAEGYVVKGTLYNGSSNAGDFEHAFKSLPAAVKTEFGTLTFTQNTAAKKWVKEAFQNGRALNITIVPPVVTASSYVSKLSVAPTSKLTSIAELTLQDNNVRRAIDYLDALVAAYNGQANADKNEIALKTEEFINGRLEKIDAELGTTEGALESYKKRNRVTELSLDASQTVAQASQYSSRLS